MNPRIRPSRLLFRRPAVGIAIGAHRATAALERSSDTPPIDRQDFVDGAAALKSLIADPKVLRMARRSGVRIALLPPLVEDRVVAFDGLSAQQAERALSFRAARHFSKTVEDPVIAAIAQPVGTGRKVDIASMASDTDIRRIHAVIAAARVRCLGVYSGCGVWLQQDSNMPRVLLHDGVLIAAIRSGNRFTDLRRIPLWSSTIGDVLGKAGLSSEELEDASATDAGTFTARLMVTTGNTELRTRALRQARSRRARHRTAIMLGMAALTVTGAYLAEYLAQGRELNQLRLERRQLAEAASLEVNQRNRRDALAAALTEIAAAERAPSVPGILAELLPLIPAGTALDMLEIGSDELVLAGGAPAADGVFAQLVAAPLTSRVEWVGPVRRSAEGGSHTEFFGLTATLSSGMEIR